MGYERGRRVWELRLCLAYPRQSRYERNPFAFCSRRTIRAMSCWYAMRFGSNR